MAESTSTRGRIGIESRLRKYDPRDTDGDGDCGQRFCPYCSDTRITQQHRSRAVMQVALALFNDVFEERTLVEHVKACFPEGQEWAHYLLALVWDYEDHDDEISPLEMLDYVQTLGWGHLRLATNLREVAYRLHPGAE